LDVARRRFFAWTSARSNKKLFASDGSGCKPIGSARQNAHRERPFGGKGGWYGDDLTEKEGGDNANIDLPPQQVELVKAMTAAGKPTVAVVAMARPQGLALVIDKLPAVLTAYYGGPREAVAIADALFGITNPSGNCPSRSLVTSGRCRSTTASVGAAAIGGRRTTSTKAISTCRRRRSSPSVKA
jgi:hypothetical protein